MPAVGELQVLRRRLARIAVGLLRIFSRVHLGLVVVAVAVGVDLVRVGAEGDFGGIGQAVAIAVLVCVVQHHHGKWFFECPVPLVGRADAYGEYGVGFVVEDGCRLQRTVRV